MWLWSAKGLEGVVLEIPYVSAARDATSVIPWMVPVEVWRAITNDAVGAADMHAFAEFAQVSGMPRVCPRWSSWACHV